MNDEKAKTIDSSVEREGAEGGKGNYSSKEKKGKRKGNRYGKKSGRFGSSRDSSKGLKFNDVSYYMKNQVIADAFGKLPFNYIVGSKPVNLFKAITMMAISSYGVDWTVNSINVDGKEVAVRDILNEVASIIYTSMRRSNSGSTNGIEYVDVIVSNLIAGIDILVNCVVTGRMFKVANSFSWKNRTIPRMIFKMMGIDYDDFVSNQANYRGRLNTLLAEARTIKVLHNYPFVDAILAEFSEIFKDSDTDTGREQLIVPMKYFHHIYDPVGTTNYPGGSVRLMYVSDLDGSTNRIPIITTAIFDSANAGVAGSGYKPGTMRKFSVDLDIIKAQINALVTDADFNLIQADLEKAFGESGSYLTVDVITSDENFTPKYSPEFWDMFHNGLFLPFPIISRNSNDYSDKTKMFFRNSGIYNGTLQYLGTNLYVNSIYQAHDSNSGRVKLGSWLHWCVFGGTAPFNISLPVGNVIDSQKDNPEVADIMIMTRFKSLYKRYKGLAAATDNPVPADFRMDDTNVNAGWTYWIPEAQSNFVVFGGVTVCLTFDANGLAATENWTEWNNCGQYASSQEEIPLIQFEHRPLVENVIDPGIGGQTPIIMVMNDTNNVRGVSIDELFNIHETAFLSLWSLPEKTNF